jgi:hypothetical protein
MTLVTTFIQESVRRLETPPIKFSMPDLVLDRHPLLLMAITRFNAGAPHAITAAGSKTS